jgi:hypothetical protein
VIGVIAQQLDYPVIREFFELFKTPWESYRADRNYDVVLCATDSDLRNVDTRLAIIYGASLLNSDAQHGFVPSRSNLSPKLQFGDSEIPIYGGLLSFTAGGSEHRDEDSNSTMIATRRLGTGGEIVRIGYDLFDEVRKLLANGQPIENAEVPALELHIEILRQQIIRRGIPLVEVLPVPAGYNFVASLTHDVDHPSIRRHRFDHTMFGFLYRAVIGSVRDFGRRRARFSHVVRNWVATAKLPFVYLGLADDFWADFDRYCELEGTAPSTFFFIPFKGHAGLTEEGPAPAARAAGYGAAEFQETISKLLAKGCEVGVHGLDCWRDTERGAEEFGLLRKLTSKKDLGVRMHWLYFGKNSPETLEASGAIYDSTVGYNETIGFRVGTAQAYKPLDAKTLLELPMHVMDTALFYPAHLNLSKAAAATRTDKVIAAVERFGGCLTINWHDRSIAPERLWGDFYVELIAKLRAKNVWLATAAQATGWFRKRRSVVFECDSDSGKFVAGIRHPGTQELPLLKLRIYGNAAQNDSRQTVPFTEIAFDESVDLANLAIPTHSKQGMRQ